MANRFRFGVTYYPEHWPAENWPYDLDRIKAAGMNVVRLGEGAWWYWEPEEGRYQFELFDRVIDLCRERDIAVIMGTPTYCGPAWIASTYPDVLRWNIDRTPMAHGSRRNFNYTSEKYLELSDGICRALAKHYAGEPQIVSWQLDNEFNCHMDVSYAPSDTAAFRAWLAEKYGTLDALNAAWGTRFWSQVYTDWDQIDLPAPTPTLHNPTQLLDESRFISDCVVRFARRQAEILRTHNPGWKITHNGLFQNVNGPDLARELDFFSHDHYPLFWPHWSEFSQKLIEARSLSFPYAILEQQAGPGGQMTYLQRTPEPGEMRLWTYQSLAHGADQILYFTWRTAPFGSEQHWHGLIDQDGKETRRLREATATAAELMSLPEAFLDAEPVKAVGILRDFDVEVSERRINTYTHEGRWGAGRWAAAFAKRHVPVDHVWPDDDFSGYRVIVAAHQKIVDAALLAKLTRFVNDGGTLVLGAQSGLHDRNLHIVEATPPGALAALAGVEVEDWTTLAKGERRKMHVGDGLAVEAFAFAERLRLVDAKPLATWDAPGLLHEGAAVAERRLGRGRVVYIGAYVDQAGTDVLSVVVAPEVTPTVAADASVECVVRRGGGRTFVALLNHAPTEQRVAGLPTEATSLIGPQPVAGVMTLPPYGVAIVAAPIGAI